MQLWSKLIMCYTGTNTKISKTKAPETKCNVLFNLKYFNLINYNWNCCFNQKNTKVISTKFSPMCCQNNARYMLYLWDIVLQCTWVLCCRVRCCMLCCTAHSHCNPYTEGLHWGRGFLIYWVLPRVSTSSGEKKNKFTPYSKHIDLFLTFTPANQNILAWASLHFSMLQHCISSMLWCNQNARYMQGPKNNYTHAYSHPQSNLLSSQSFFCSFLVFSLLQFLSFMPIQLPLANWWLTIWRSFQMWLSNQSNLKKTQCTPHE